MKSIAIAVGVFVVAAPSVAAAHVVMTSPTPRSEDDGLTMAPCGGVASGAPQAFMAGETITVEWEVAVSHGGAITIDFSEADDMNFDDHILAMDLDEMAGATGSADVELPDVDCEQCTLRVVQVNPGKDDYHSCADISLTGATGGTGSTGSTGGDSADTGSTGDGGGDDTTGGGGSGSSGAGDGEDSSGGDDSASTSGVSASASNGGPTAGTGDSSAGDGGSGDGDDGCGCRVRSTPGFGLSMLAILFGLGLRRRRRA
jgi:MYXO-CTERM domain-containing protein